MNKETGELKDILEAQKEATEKGIPFDEMFMPVENNEMTEKQKETKQVSKHDNKSVLGKKFTLSRRFKKGKYGRI